PNLHTLARSVRRVAGILLAPPMVLFALLAVAATPSIYHVDPLLDGAVIAAGAVATIVPYTLAEKLIDPSCPCDPARLNRLDRSVVGNESELAYAFATIATGLAMFTPIAVDIAEIYHSP